MGICLCLSVTLAIECEREAADAGMLRSVNEETRSVIEVYIVVN